MHLRRLSARWLTAIALAIGCSVAAAVSPAPMVQPTGALTPEQASQDVRVLRRAMTALHPALTKYRKQPEIDAAFARFDTRGSAARNVAEMYLAATELAAAIRCGHTWTNVLNQRDAMKKALLDAADKLPFTMTFVEDRWLVLASVDKSIATGDEVVSIDGVGARDIAARMMPYLRADGSSDGKRLMQLNHDREDFSMMDIVWPLLMPPMDDSYRLDVRRADGRVETIRVQATTIAARQSGLNAQGIRASSEDWQFRVEKNVGVLTMPTFSFWRSKFDWVKFLDSTFADLDDRKIPNLIIDIRANEGGDGAIGTKLLSYLLSKPYSYTSDQSISAYERVPYVLVKYLDTWDYGFFDRTGKVEKISDGPNAGRYIFKPRAFGQRTIDPAKTPYAGRTYLMVGAENSSATFMLADFAKKSGAATLVGQITGGNQRGLNGGELAWVTLPNSGVAVDIPLLAATYQASTPDASVVPDIVVKRTFSARVAGRDQEMEAVMREIAGK
jgi:C-terminal processing protease CtpA/Prc